MKIAVLGSTGMLGHKVLEVLREKYGKENVLGSGRNFSPGEIKKCDFFLDACLKDFATLKKVGPFDYIINCIGIIKPFIEKVGPAKTVEINSVFPHRLAEYCVRKETKLIHITTDCVFSGDRGGYTEEDNHDATDLYGKSKSLGEPTNCMVLRTSIIGEEEYNKVSLVEWAKSQKGEEVNGFLNHLWNGITTKTYGEICSQIIDDDLYENGVSHIFSPHDITKYDLLRLLNNKFDLNLEIEKKHTEFKVDRTLQSVKELADELTIPDIGRQIEEM